MNKILTVFLMIFLTATCSGLSNKAFSRETPTASEANTYCVKGDKILNFYEGLKDTDKRKANQDRYLNAAKYFYYQANRLDMSNQNAFIGRARIALIQGRTRDAKNNLMIALNVNELNPKVNYYLGETFFEEGEYTQAIDFYYFAYSHGYKYDYKINMKLGICYEKLDDIKKARYHYTNAAKINPGDVTAKARLGGLDAINTNYETYNVFQDDSLDSEEDISPEDLKNLHAQ
ncbi:MAG: tetratricopeptide repeat protein [Clostridium sp.]|nr:tetratricopeptide repeat protein [Clostridium sp.]